MKLLQLISILCLATGTLIAGADPINSNTALAQKYLAAVNMLEQEKAQKKGHITDNRIMEVMDPIIAEALAGKDFFAENSDLNFILKNSHGSDIKEWIHDDALIIMIRIAGRDKDPVFKQNCVDWALKWILSPTCDSFSGKISILLECLSDEKLYSGQNAQKIKDFIIGRNELCCLLLLLAEKASLFKDADFVKYLKRKAVPYNNFVMGDRDGWIAAVFLARNNDSEELKKILKTAAFKNIKANISSEEFWRVTKMLDYLILIRKPEIVLLLKEYLKSDMKYNIGSDMYIAVLAADILSGMFADFPCLKYPDNDSDLSKNKIEWLKWFDQYKNSSSFKFKEEDCWDHLAPAFKIYSEIF